MPTTNALDAFMRDLPQISTETCLVEALATVLRAHGFIEFNYGSGKVTETGGLIANRIWSTMDPTWIQHYAANRYYRDDRLVRACLVRVDPFTYEEIFSTPPRSARQLEMETRFGYASGVMASTRGFDGTIGILSAARDPAMRGDIAWPTLATLQLITTVFHQHAETLDLPRSPVALEVPPIELTEREAQCLTWASAGKSNRDIADLLNIKPRTVKKYIEGAMHKLGTGKRTQAVARALALGLIKP